MSRRSSSAARPTNVPHTPSTDQVPVLHNSGPSPMQVYRTASVGQVYRLDIGALLLQWDALPNDLRGPMRCNAVGPEGPTADHFCPPALAEGIAHFLLERLGSERSAEMRDAESRRLAAFEHEQEPRQEPDAEKRARAALARLAHRVAELGWLPPFHGIARSEQLSNPRNMSRATTALQNEWPWLPSGEGNRVLRHAWCVLAVSYLSPPLILWTREPSLAWWRGDLVISLRWFGEMGCAR